MTTTPNEPRSCAIEHTLEFLERALPAGTGTVLEVGAGDGLLAAALAARGFDVLALDEDPEAVNGARTRGVTAHQARFPDFTGGPYDVVLFTRSLHHIGPLDPALDASWKLLGGKGTLVVEDFAWERQTPVGAAWVARVLEPFEPEDGEAAADPVARWREHYEHHGVHTGETLIAAVTRRFTVTSMETAPCLYRYVCSRAPRNAEGVAAARRVYEAERRAIHDGVIPAIGLRLVAVPRDVAT
jgi:SAM-dependent methyltransferase